MLDASSHRGSVLSPNCGQETDATCRETYRDHYRLDCQNQNTLLRNYDGPVHNEQEKVEQNPSDARDLYGFKDGFEEGIIARKRQEILTHVAGLRRDLVTHS